MQRNVVASTKKKNVYVNSVWVREATMAGEKKKRSMEKMGIECKCKYWQQRWSWPKAKATCVSCLPPAGVRTKMRGIYMQMRKHFAPHSPATVTRKSGESAKIAGGVLVFQHVHLFSGSPASVACVKFNKALACPDPATFNPAPSAKLLAPNSKRLTLAQVPRAKESGKPARHGTAVGVDVY